MTAAYISGKTSWIRFLVSFLPSAGTAALCWVLLSGPRLGPLYDFLLRQRPATPVSRELLIIDSGIPGQELGEDILEPGTASSLLYTMTEFGAHTLIIQVPILGLAAGGNAAEEEILYRFDEEFSLLSRNIRNLFDAIRTGSVAPGDAARYVGELVELSDKGKERLVSALVRRDGEGIDSMEKAAAFFGHVRRPGDLRVQLIRAEEGGLPGVSVERNEYSRARPDRDGITRRIAPVLSVPFFQDGTPEEKSLEHVIYGALKARYKTSGIEYIGSHWMPPGGVLAVRGKPDGADTIIPLDRNGALLFELPSGGDDFRRIGILDFLAYDEADRSLRRLLAEGESLGIFQDIKGEDRPGILYDYALSLREELSSSAGSGNEQNKPLWIEARQNYFESLDDFLYGPAEMNLVGNFEEIIAFESWESKPLGEAEAAKLAEMRDAVIRAFVALRTKYSEVLELRRKLESALSGSFCILGRASSSLPPETRSLRPSLFQDFSLAAAGILRKVFPRFNPGDTEVSALLANSILTGRAVKPGDGLFLLLAALFLALLTCFLSKSLKAAPTLGLGALLIFLTGAGFSLGFIFSGVWFDPLVPVAAECAGILISFTWALIVRGRYARRFRLAFGPFISRPCLKSVIRDGRPLPSQSVTVKAAIVAIRNTDPAVEEDSSRFSAPQVLLFREQAAEIFKKAGGTVIGTEGGLVLACFGSPLERVFVLNQKKAGRDNIRTKKAPALRAAEVVSSLAGRSEYSSWQFGIDMGSCAFTWTALSGYFAVGAAVGRAKTLARLASRYSVQAAVSSAIKEALPEIFVTKKLGVLKEKDGTGGEPFYRLENQ